MKIRRWILFEKSGVNEVPYILDAKGLDVLEEELCLCIEEQIYGGLK